MLKTTDNTVGQNHNFPKREGHIGEVLILFLSVSTEFKSTANKNVVYTNIIIPTYKFWFYQKGSSQVPSTLKHAFLP